MGMAFSLTPDDHIFGSHRSHGEILAKGFAAIRQLGDRELQTDHGDLRGRRAAPSGRARLQRVGQRAGAPVLHLRGLLRDLRARHRLQPRAGRVDARVLRPVRDLPEQRDRRRLGLDRAWRLALQARQPQAGHRCRQYRRCVVRLWSGLGGNHVLRDGPVPAPVGSVARRRTAHPVQLHQQLLRHGRAAVRRDDGGRLHCPRRRRRQSRSDARGACQRLRPAARHRCVPPEERHPAGWRRPRAARDDYLSNQRPLALGRIQLPLEGRDRELAAGGFDQGVSRQTDRERRHRGSGAGRVTRRARSDDRRDAAALGGSRRQSARRPGFRAGRAR